MAKTDNYKKHTSSNPLKKFFTENFFNAFLKQIEGLNIETVLDVGCGEGFTLKKLEEKGIGKKLLGIDSSKEAIDLGKKQYPSLDLNLGDIFNIKAKDKSFDLVICTEVLEHLKEPDKAIRELKRVSKKFIILSVPHEPFFKLFNFTQWGKDIGHINNWSLGSFKKLLMSEELTLLKVKLPFPWILVLAKS